MNHFSFSNNEHQPSSTQGRVTSGSSSHSSRVCNNGTREQRVVYTYDLPYPVRKSLYDLMDADNSWRSLAGEYLGQSEQDIILLSHNLLRGVSPTQELLLRWEKANPRVELLFKYLLSMKHYRAMRILKPFVDPALASFCDDYQAEEFSFFLNDKHNSASSLIGAVGGQSLDTNVHNYVNLPEKVINRPNNNWNFSQLKACSKSEVKPNNSESNNSRIGSVPSQVDEDMDILYKELMIGTDDFSEDRIIGSGGFGIVYKGELKGTEVAIKRLKGLNNVSQVINELKVLNRYRIDNIVPLYGISLDGPDACIVYQYMPNGSLEDRLLCKGPDKTVLTWEQRANIGEGIAKGLNYLHTLKGKPLVHGDVKSANVLLDAQFEPKLGDFGLSRMISGFDKKGVYTHVTVTQVHGTSVYLPAEYLRQKILSPAVDTYSYGIVVLEMATGRRAFDGKKLLIDLVDEEMKAGETDATREGGIRLKDPRMGLNPNEEASNVWFHSLITLGTDCANKVKKKRPNMNQVLDFFAQCKTRDRVRRISVESCKQSSPTQCPLPDVTELKTPLELQLWYDMVKKEVPYPDSTVCPTFGSAGTRHLTDHSRFDTQSSNASSVIQNDSTSLYEDVVPSILTMEGDGGEAAAMIPLITELGISTPQNSSCSSKSQDSQPGNK